MTNRSELLTLVAAIAPELLMSSGRDETKGMVAERVVDVAAAIIKAMDEVSATVNSSQVDSSKDAEIARLKDLCETASINYRNLYDSFAAYRSRMESPLTDEECNAAQRLVDGEFSDLRMWSLRYDAAIRKVREGRMP